MHDEILGEDMYGDDVYGDDSSGDQIVGDELGDDLLGDDLLGDEFGDDVMGDEFGDELVGDEFGDDVGLFRRRRRRRNANPNQDRQRRRREAMLQRENARLRRALAGRKPCPDPTRRAIAERRALAGKVVQTKGYAKGRVQPVGFTSLQIPAGQTVDIPTRPQTLFRGTRLVIPSTIAPNFVVEDIKVGRNSQFVASGGQPGEVFKDTATGDNVTLDTCAPGMDITLKVTNITGTVQDFRAALIGDVVE